MAGDFVVVGLGMFGRSVAVSLARLDQSVLGIDRSEAIVQSVADEIDRAVCADATDEQAIAGGNRRRRAVLLRDDELGVVAEQEEEGRRTIFRVIRIPEGNRVGWLPTRVDPEG